MLFRSRGTVADYPIVATTHRSVDHLHTGAVTRRLPWLIEIAPEMSVEMSHELADEIGVSDGDAVIIDSARGSSVRAKAVVTGRIKPLSVNGTTVHNVSLPWNWGYMGLSTGDSTNLLTARVGDPNTGIPEYRAFLCNIQKA